MSTGPYTLGKMILEFMQRWEVDLPEAGKQLGIETSQVRVFHTLAKKLEPSIGEDLDRDPFWVRNAYALCSFQHETQHKLHSGAKRYGPAWFMQIVRRVKLGPPRSVALDAWENLMMDTWPRNAAIVDFDLRDTDHYGALQFAVRSGVSAWELDLVLGDGKSITELCLGFKDNPYKATFVTAYDRMSKEEE